MSNTWCGLGTCQWFNKNSVSNRPMVSPSALESLGSLDKMQIAGVPTGVSDSFSLGRGLRSCLLTSSQVAPVLLVRNHTLRALGGQGTEGGGTGAGEQETVSSRAELHRPAQRLGFNKQQC